MWLVHYQWNGICLDLAWSQIIQSLEIFLGIFIKFEVTSLFEGIENSIFFVGFNEDILREHFELRLLSDLIQRVVYFGCFVGLVYQFILFSSPSTSPLSKASSSGALSLRR